MEGDERVARNSRWYALLALDSNVRVPSSPFSSGLSNVYDLLMRGVEGANEISQGSVTSLQITLCEWQMSKRILIVPSPLQI